MHPATQQAFADELEKIAGAHARLVPKSRTGRRPISVERLLEKDKDGTLHKKADAAGSPQPWGEGPDDPGAATLPKSPGDRPRREGNKETAPSPSNTQGSSTDGLGRETKQAADAALGNAGNVAAFQEGKTPRRRGDIPSRDDLNAVDRRDGRGEATTVHGLAQNSEGIGVTTPAGG